MSANPSDHPAAARRPTDPPAATPAPRPAAADRSLLLRGWVITILLAALAAFLGARLGSHQPPALNVPLSERVFELLEDSIELTASQRESIDRITERYAPERETLLLQSRNLNARLATLMAEEERFGPLTENALDDLQDVMGERLKLSLNYMLEVRQVLEPEQRVLFDRKVVDEASRSR